MSINLKKLSEKRLFALHNALTTEMLRRKLIRTMNNPVADYGEYTAAKLLKLKLTGNSNKGYDAADSKGIKYQIKTRRITRENGSAQLGVIRSLNKRHFDQVLAILFNEDFSVKIIYKIPRACVRKYGRFSEHQNGHILNLRGRVLEDYRVKKIKFKSSII